MAEPTEIRLLHPVTRDGATITALTVRRPKVADLRALDELPAGASMLVRELFMVSRLTSLPEAALDELDATDYRRLVDAASGFSEAASGDGGPTSPLSPA